MTTDFRALCAELLQAWDDLPWEYDWKGNPVGPLAEIDDTPFEHARAALAQPEPEFTAEEVEMIQAPWSYLAPAQPEPVGPTDEELLRCMIEAAYSVPGGQSTGIIDWEREAIAAARAVLTRWGRPAPPLPKV